MTCKERNFLRLAARLGLALCCFGCFGYTYAQSLSPVAREGTVSAEMSQRHIQKKLRKVARKVRVLYEAWLVDQPALAGTLNVFFVIKTDGTIRGLRVVDNSIQNEDFEENILVTLAKHLQFDAAYILEETEVIFPLELSPQTKAASEAD